MPVLGHPRKLKSFGVQTLHGHALLGLTKTMVI